jgi:formate dehydrogenase maturation protein FdhE
VPSAISYSQHAQFTCISKEFKKKHPLKVNSRMQRGQNSHLRGQGVPVFKAQATTQEDEDEREVAKNQVAYAANMELRSEGKCPLAIEVYDTHPGVRAVLTSLPQHYIPKGKKAIVDKIDTLVDLRVFR